jgi:hypothetical protein
VIKAIPPRLTPSQEAETCPALKDPVIGRCAGVWTAIFYATLDKTNSISDANRCANIAFRTASPPLSGYQNICDFIACVGYGVLLGAIKPDIGTKPLYGAQVAHAAIPQNAKIQTRMPVQAPTQIPTVPKAQPEAQTQSRTRSRAAREPHPSPTLAATQ